MARLGWRRLLVAIAASILFVFVLEGILRGVGSGEDRSLFRSAEVEGGNVWTINPDFFDLFFPPPLRPVPLPLSVPRAKQAGEVRVVLLGGSAAMGSPAPSYGMAPMLEEWLRNRHPQSRIEVLNLASR